MNRHFGNREPVGAAKPPQFSACSRRPTWASERRIPTVKIGRALRIRLAYSTYTARAQLASRPTCRQPFTNREDPPER